MWKTIRTCVFISKSWEGKRVWKQLLNLSLFCERCFYLPHVVHFFHPFASFHRLGPMNYYLMRLAFLRLLASSTWCAFIGALWFRGERTSGQEKEYESSLTQRMSERSIVIIVYHKGKCGRFSNTPFFDAHGRQFFRQFDPIVRLFSSIYYHFCAPRCLISIIYTTKIKSLYVAVDIMISNNVKGSYRSRTLIKKKSIFLSEHILSERRSRNPKGFISG